MPSRVESSVVVAEAPQTDTDGQPAITDTAASRGRRFAWLAKIWRGRTAQARIVLALIFVIAILSRVLGTRFGFPMLLHPDEWAIVDGAVDMAKRNSFEPPWNMRPDHVEMKIDYLLFTGYSTLFKHTSTEAAFAQNPVPFYWIARLTTAAFGVATVALGYLIGRLTSRRLGLIVAALFAVFPAFVLHAHYATPDVPLTFALMLLVYALMHYVRTASRRSLLWSSFAVALGIAIKYPAAVGAMLIVLVVAVVAVRDKAWKRLVVHEIMSLAAVLGYLFLISPSLFTNFSDVRHQWSVQSKGDALGHPDLGLFGNLHFYVTTYVDYAGVVLSLLALVGVVIVIRRRRLDTLPWLIGILVWGALSRLPLTWERWGVPMWVTPLLLAAVAIDYLFEQFPSRRSIWLPVAVSAICAAQLSAGSVAVDAGFVVPDTRSASLTYVNSHGITRTNSIYDGYTPLLPGAPWLFFKQVKKVGNDYRFFTLEGRPAEYAILSSGMYGRVLADPTEPANQQIYQWIFTHGTLLAQFTPMHPAAVSAMEPKSIMANLRFANSALDGGAWGPTIKIYKLPTVAP